jgi:hypothetical protein
MPNMTDEEYAAEADHKTTTEIIGSPGAGKDRRLNLSRRLGLVVFWKVSFPT